MWSPKHNIQGHTLLRLRVKKLQSQVASLSSVTFPRVQLELKRSWEAVGEGGGASDQPTGRGNARAGETAHVKTSRSEAKSERTEHARQHRVRRKENQGELRRRGGSNTKFPATLCSLKSTV